MIISEGLKKITKLLKAQPNKQTYYVLVKQTPLTTEQFRLAVEDLIEFPCNLKSDPMSGEDFKSEEEASWFYQSYFVNIVYQLVSSLPSINPKDYGRCLDIAYEDAIENTKQRMSGYLKKTRESRRNHSNSFKLGTKIMAIKSYLREHGIEDKEGTIQDLMRMFEIKYNNAQLYYYQWKKHWQFQGVSTQSTTLLEESVDTEA